MPSTSTWKWLFCCLVLLFLLPAHGPVRAETWTFSVISDIHSEFEPYRAVLEKIRGPENRAAEKVHGADFVLVCGDMSPLPRNHEIFQEVFLDQPTFFVPVRGNHEKAADVDHIKRVILPGHGRHLHYLEGGGVSYALDWRNIRVIVLDQYAGLGKSLDHWKVLAWLEHLIISADHADHVFLAFHEPLVPWFPREDPLWSLLTRHAARVRAVFVGHTHIYSRRVIEGEGGTVQLINAGNAGRESHSDGHLTIVRVFVEKDRVMFRTLQAPHETRSFHLREQWQWSQK